MNRPLIVTVKEACAILRLARAKVYILIQDGYLKACKIGADWRISLKSIESLAGPIPDQHFSNGRLSLKKENILSSKSAENSHVTKCLPQTAYGDFLGGLSED